MNSDGTSTFECRDGRIYREGIYLPSDVAERLLDNLKGQKWAATIAEQLRVALHEAANIAHERDAA